MTTALVALGSNLGDRQATLDRALEMLGEKPGVRLLAASSPHATRPIGGPPGQAEFLNAAAVIETSLAPEALLVVLQEVEQSLGRTRDGRRWIARPIDLDLLLFGSEIIDKPDLIVPHPRMAFRRFVIEPAAEAAPDMRHPTIGWTLAELRDHLRAAVPYVAIAGAPGIGKSELAAGVAASLGIRLLADPTKQFAEAAGGASASGPASAREIELLDARTTQLAEAFATDRETARPANQLCGTTISDYWFDEALCHADSILPPVEAKEFRGRWESAAKKIVRPKLLVLLDAPADWIWNRVVSEQKPATWSDPAAFDRLHRCIVERALKAGHGPVVQLDARRPDDARIELSAAVQAMS